MKDTSNFNPNLKSSDSYYSAAKENISMKQHQRLSRNNPPNTSLSIETDEVPEADHSVDFKLERYKYILQQIHSLNENVHKFLTLFQALATGIIGGGIWLFVSWKNLNINADVVKAGIQGLLGLLLIITLFVVLSLVGGILSWMDYRREEVELLNETVGSGFRKFPRLSNFWRWYETYVIIFIVFIVLVIILYTELQVIPLIH